MKRNGGKIIDKMHSVIYGLFFIIVILYLLKSFLISDLTSESAEINMIEGKVAQLQMDNMQLKEQLLHKESLTYLNDIARQTGFIDASYIFLKKK